MPRIEMSEEITSEGIEYYVGCGNVFADLGLPNPEELQLKSTLSIEIQRAIRKKRLTRNQIATLLDLSKEDLAKVIGHGFSDYSINELIGYLNCLGHDVQLFAEVTEREADAKKALQKKEWETALA
jgi:predicted XRE-type DNA-binding protein